MHLEGGGGVGVGIERPHEAAQLVAPELRTESKSPSYGISFLLQVSTAPKMKWELIHCSPSTMYTTPHNQFDSLGCPYVIKYLPGWLWYRRLMAEQLNDWGIENICMLFP